MHFSVESCSLWSILCVTSSTTAGGVLQMSTAFAKWWKSGDLNSIFLPSGEWWFLFVISHRSCMFACSKFTSSVENQIVVWMHYSSLGKHTAVPGHCTETPWWAVNVSWHVCSPMEASVPSLYYHPVVLSVFLCFFLFFCTVVIIDVCWRELWTLSLLPSSSP